MQDEALVNIICITYNHAPYIRRALDGYLMQKTSFKFNVVINDDASTDGTTEIIKEYAQKYPDVIVPVYHKENQYSKGPNVAITYQMSQAKAKYYAVSEADDYWTDPLKLQLQVDYLESHPECVLCFHNVEVLSQNDAEIHMYDHLEERDYTAIEIYKKWTIPTTSAVYRNILNYSLDVFKDICYGDIFLFLNLAKHGNLHCINRKMGVYRRNEGGVSFSMNLVKAKKLIKQYKYMQNWFGYDKELVAYSRYTEKVYDWYIMYDSKEASFFDKLRACWESHDMLKSKIKGSAKFALSLLIKLIH